MLLLIFENNEKVYGFFFPIFILFLLSSSNSNKIDVIQSSFCKLCKL